MKRRVEGTENVLGNGEKAPWNVTVHPGFPGIVQIYPCYPSMIFNATPFTHKSVSVLATNCTTNLPVRYKITAFSCLKDCQMEKLKLCINEG